MTTTLLLNAFLASSCSSLEPNLSKVLVAVTCRREQTNEESLSLAVLGDDDDRPTDRPRQQKQEKPRSSWFVEELPEKQK